MDADGQIVRAVIHPGIGVARVGNSTRADGYFIGPEVPSAMPPPAGGYKDAAGALKRQAARFRLFGYDQAGAVVRELTADDADITWTVHVANKKAAWYNFEKALDIPEAIPCARRNAAYPLDQRGDLIIDPGPRAVTGRNQDGSTAQFDTGTFCGHAVYLGQLRTDAQGRLLFLGGRGHSGTLFTHNPLTTYGNNNGWYDDISDGPVTAQVTLHGRAIPVDPAWVVVAPPNYAPDLISIQTMYSVMVDAYQHWWLAPITRPSFTQDIYPILGRLCDLAWVNYGFHIQFG
jgi:L-lysine epsilon oxidase-like protein